MRAPLSWIRELTPVEATPAEIADALDHLGLEVEALEEPGREIGGVVVARALAVRPHPNADRLRLVDVDYGVGTGTVVCGAPNVVEGMLAPYAPVGATLPGGFTLEARKIRDVLSEGMLCSARELGLGEDHTGILALPAGVEPGTDVREVLGLDDAVFDLAITPNRPDAMCMVGVARELAAHFGLPLRVPEPDAPAGGGPSTAELVSVVVEAADRAPRFTARHLRVTMGPSPEWMAQRLTLAGMRPISNVVDVTNYVLLERGQPLHAFDLARLPGRGLVIRLARDGERITTLDRVERALTAEDLLVCDAERDPQAIAGIMGGATAEVRPDTTEILLEAAYFSPMGISRTSKRLGLRSESSARFERGIDPNGVLAGSTRAAQLLLEVAGASVAPEPVDLYPQPVPRERITVRVPRINALLGTHVDGAQVREALTPLGIDVEGSADTFVAVPPTFRPDLTREIDVVEEVARRIGLDEIPRTLPHTTAQGGGLTPRQRERRLVQDVMVAMGCSEAMCVPMVAPRWLEAVGIPTEGLITVTNSLRAEESLVRPALLPGLLGVAAYNASFGLADLALFETGHVFLPPTPETAPLPDERDHLGVLLTGTLRRAPVEPDRPVDPYDVVDVLDALVEALELEDVRLEAADVPGYVAGRAGAVVVDGETIGRLGTVDPGALASFGAPAPAVALELRLDRLLDARRRDRAFRTPSRFPASSIDLAFVLAESVPAGAVVATIRSALGDVVENVHPFDEFRNAALGEGRRSVAFAVRLRAADRTLTDAEVGSLRERAIEAVVRAHGAELRG